MFLYCRHVSLGCHFARSCKRRRVRPIQYWKGELQRKLKCWKNSTDWNWYSIFNYWCSSSVLEAFLYSKWYLFWLSAQWRSSLLESALTEGTFSLELYRLNINSSDYASIWRFPCSFNSLLSSWLCRLAYDVLLITFREAAMLFSRSEWKQWYCLQSVLGCFEMRST